MVEKFRMTADEVFELPESNNLIELLDGELIVSPPPLVIHQRLIGDTYVLLRQIVPNGTVFLAPIAVYLDDDNVPEPDIVWVAANSKCVVTEKRLEGPPDLIVEVLSPGTARRDRKDKFNLYEKYGVREYWMFEPQEQYAEIYRLENNAFVRQGVYGPDESFVSAALGDKTVDLSNLFTSEK
jgi:Uma2 family endonuclease